MDWSNNTYIVPFSILQQYLCKTDLLNFRQLSHFFKHLVYKEAFHQTFNVSSLNIISGIYLERMFKNISLEVEIYTDSRYSFSQMAPDEQRIYAKKERREIKILDSILPKLNRVTSLSLTFNRGKVSGDGVIQYQRNLETLILWGDNQISGWIVTTFNKLTTLNLGYNSNVKDHHLICLPGLTSLDLTNNTTITDYGISTLTNLTDLSLYDEHAITDQCVSKLTKLQSLSMFGSTTITDDGIKNLTNLRTLCLRSNFEITDRGIEKLNKLTYLNIVDQRKITDVGLQHLTKLETLRIGVNPIPITDDAIMKLVNLTTLDADNTIITDRGLSTLTNLTSLRFYNNNFITNAGLVHLVHLNDIWYDPCHSPVTREGLALLPKLTTLDELYSVHQI